MHKIIKDYIAGRRVTDILKEANEENNFSQPVEIAFSLIFKQMVSGELSADIEEEIETALKVGHSDEEVFLLFISYLNYFYYVKKMHEKCDGVFRILKSFDVKNYSLEIQAFYYQRCAYYYDFVNDYKKRDEANLISISKMPKDCPIYRKFLLNTSIVFSASGRLQELSTEELKILEDSIETNSVALEALIVNAIFNGNINLLEKYLSIMTLNYKNKKFMDKFKYYNQAKNVLKGEFEENEPIVEIRNICLSYYKALKNGDLDSAKKIFRKMGEKYLDQDHLSLFCFANFHHAFVTNRFEMITSRNPQNEHYFFDFFLVRFYLIKDKKELARFHYAQLLKNCEKYQSIGRLKFEMQFAFELNTLTFFELTQPLKLEVLAIEKKELEIAVSDPTIISSGVNRIVGSSKVMTEIKNKILKYCNIQRPILVIGETGSGKEVVARAISEESSGKDKPFLAINCGALTDTLLQSELFGYESGAFTGAVTAHQGIFEAAEDGFVFLDEFGEMSTKLQVSLLRVLENKEIMRVGGTTVKKINCRIIAATNSNIKDLISKKLFREDLYHRLKQFTISLPPLRDRKEDLPELLDYFLNQNNNNIIQKFSSDLMDIFQEYHWPGNIRELKNEIDRIKIFCGYKPVIEINDVDIEWLKNNKNNYEIMKSKIEIPNNVNDDNLDKQIHQRLINKKLSLADKRNQQILKLFQQYKKLKRGEIAEALQVSLVTMSKDLQRLTDEGVIIQIKPTLSPRSYYFELVEDKK